MVMSAMHRVAQAQLGPACRSDHKQDQHLAATVCGMQQAERIFGPQQPKLKNIMILSAQKAWSLSHTASLKSSPALPVVAPQMWMEMKQAERRKQLNMPEKQTCQNRRMTETSRNIKHAGVNMPANLTWIWCPQGFLLQSLLLELNRPEKQTCQNRPETQLGKHTGKRNMNLMSKRFTAPVASARTKQARKANMPKQAGDAAR